jgi:hypothetical protein
LVFVNLYWVGAQVPSRSIVKPFRGDLLRRLNPSNHLYPKFELDAEGLNESNPEYLTVAFDHLSEQKARAYIENFNREHGELANPMAILFPGLFLICFGPTPWTVMRSLGFIGWITSLFHDI